MVGGQLAPRQTETPLLARSASPVEPPPRGKSGTVPNLDTAFGWTPLSAPRGREPRAAARARGSFALPDGSLCSEHPLAWFASRSAAKNKETGTVVAIKRVSPMCSSSTDGKHTLREIR